jgi:hypothetical protein
MSSEDDLPRNWRAMKNEEIFSAWQIQESEIDLRQVNETDVFGSR